MKLGPALAWMALLAAGVLAPAPSASAAKNPPTHKIDVNLAGAKELQELPGVGPTTAKAIIQFRTKSGRFHRVEDLLAIRGISETKLAKMRPYIVVTTPPAPPPKKAPSSAAPKPAQTKSAASMRLHFVFNASSFDDPPAPSYDANPKVRMTVL
jgi:competence ComEA-like helix-hairpin-helix protein